MEYLLMRRLISEEYDILIFQFRVMDKRMLLSPQLESCLYFKKGRMLIQKQDDGVTLYISGNEYKRLGRLMDKKWKQIELKSKIFSLSTDVELKAKEEYLNMLIQIDKKVNEGMAQFKNQFGIDARVHFILDSKAKEDELMFDLHEIDYEIKSKNYMNDLIIKFAGFFHDRIVDEIMVPLYDTMQSYVVEHVMSQNVYANDDEEDYQSVPMSTLDVCVRFNPDILFELAVNRERVLVVKTGLFFNVSINGVSL